MRSAQRSGAGERWLGEGGWGRLRRRAEHMLRTVRRSGRPGLISVCEPCAELDPTAVVWNSRVGDEPWFCFEQPDRQGSALAALGSVATLQASGPERFAVVEARWRRLAAGALADPPEHAGGSGLCAVGGFAFAEDGGSAPHWQGFPAASLDVPALCLARRGARTWLTVNAAVSPGDELEGVMSEVEEGLARLRHGALPLLDPDPAAAPQVLSVMPPSHYEEAVARAVERIRAGEFEKVVLAREVEVRAGGSHDAGALLGILRDAFSSCYVYAVGRGPRTFLGASPELLVRREGQRVSTVALAGSTSRSADPAVDDHLGERLLRSVKDREENAIVARRIARALEPHSLWVTAAPEPVVVRVANIQHLAAPIRAQLASPQSAIALAGLLHPTPAVGGEPRAEALAAIAPLEGFDRGWYAGPVGWVDATGDGEFCVALRCGLIEGPVARLYAGCGIVRDSQPAAELAETETKLSALLPLLAA